MSLAAAWVEASLRSVPLLALVLVATRLFGRRLPGLRHLALVTALGGTLVMPLLARWIPAPPVLLPASLSPSGPVGAGAGAPFHAVGGGWDAAPLALALVWVAGAVALTLRLVARLVATDAHVRAAVWAGRSRRIPGSRVSLVVSSTVANPAAAGLFRPVILLPREAWRWSRRERRAVLTHEFAHLRRGDGWSRLLGEVVVILHWPDPLVWLAAAHARAAAEEAADRAAVEAGSTPEELGGLLVAVARHGLSQGRTLSFSTRGHLGKRFRTLLARPRAARPWEAGAVLVALAVVLWGVAGAEPLRPEGHEAVRWAGRYGVDPRTARRVLEAAREEGVDPELGFGLVRTESDFDPGRVSPSGATGYTQILPETAALLRPGVSSRALADPDLNLRLGFRLLRSYLDRYPGDVERALVAYHRGPRWADRAAGAKGAEPYPGRVLDDAGVGS